MGQICSIIRSITSRQSDPISLASISSSTSDGSSTCPSDEGFHSKVFPPELLTPIFECLPLRDRKSVRLTCRLWNENCNSLSIVQEEKFVFRPNNMPDLPIIEESLLNSSLRRLNLEFQGLPVNWIRASVWKKLAPRVHELRFFNTYDDEDALQNVMMECVNLESLYFDQYEFWESGFMDTLETILDNFIKENIIYEKLHSLAVFGRNFYEISRLDLFRKIFLVFPRIKHFSLEAKFIFPDESAQICFPPFTHLESLHFETFHSNLFWLEKRTLGISISSLRLKRFETTFNNIMWENLMEERVYDFFTSQKDIRSVKLNEIIHNFNYQVMVLRKKFIFHILRNCSHLQELNFSSVNSAGHLESLTCAEINEFLPLISKLKSLSLDCFSCAELPPVSKTNALNVSKLRLKPAYQDEKLCSYILKHCSRVKHLYITIRSDDTLQEIIKTLTDLETLYVVIEPESCTSAYGFTGRPKMQDRHRQEPGYSISLLQKLEHLEINLEELLSTRDLIEVVRELKFPKLNYLNLGCIRNIKLDDVVDWAKLPALEILVVFENITIEDHKKFMKPSRVLGHLIVRFDSSKILNEKVKALFIACPSLKFVSTTKTMFSYTLSKNEIIIHRNTAKFFKFPGPWPTLTEEETQNQRYNIYF